MKTTYENYPEILPKESTQALEWVSKNPEFDGRNVIVAVFDTGVDPGAAGLSITSDGKKKIIDIVDATGSGDISLSTEVVAENGVIVGLTKRTLKLGNFTNPSGKYRLGIKRAFDLFPKQLEERIKKERAEEFEKKNLLQLESLEKELEEFKNNNKIESEQQKDELKERESRIVQFKNLMKNRTDTGPIYDVVAWNDGKDWRVVIDTNESGDLTNSVPMTDYRKEYQYAMFSERDCMNYSVNIYEDGKVVSIVTNAGSHGTHVAGIVGAYFPESPELNGVAPGCQIVAVKIGDSRIGSQETGTGLVRGLLAALNNKCDLINLSYGEDSHLPNTGRFIKLTNELVYKHGIIFVSSAGNNGPALSTVGAPGGTTSSSIGVGAYVSPEMMQSQYSMREKLPSNQYTWSSRGPTTDGHYGVSVSAPGGAITSVPNWTLQKNQLMNGTSMSSPNCCGCIALILSGLKSNGIKYNQHAIRRAIENTAKKIENVEVFAQGSGIIQVNSAFEFMKTFYSGDSLNVRYEVSLDKGSRGIYIRDYPQSDSITTKIVNVEPIFHESVPNKEKISFEKRITIKSNVDWIETPTSFLLMNQKKGFSVKVNPTNLEVGKVHYAEVHGIDESQPDAGALFRLPVTVIRPETVNDNIVKFSETEKFSPGKIVRKFVTVPEGSTHAIWRFKGESNEKVGRLFLLHSVQLRPQIGYSYTEFQKYLRFIGDHEEKNTIEVSPGRTCEFLISQFWSNLGESNVSSEIEFIGIQSNVNPCVHNGNSKVNRIEIRSPKKFVSLKPSVSLKTVSISKRPSKNSLRQLPDNYRDRLWNGKNINELILTYEFNVAEACKVAITASSLNELLYDSPLESQFWMIFVASTKEYKGCGDALGRYKVDLQEGNYVAHFQLRTDDVDTLEKLKQMPVVIEYHLTKETTLDIYSDRVNAFLNGSSGKVSNKVLHRNKATPLFVVSPQDSSLPKQAIAGSTLSGTLMWNKEAYPDLKIPYFYNVPTTVLATATSTQSPPSNLTDEEQFNQSLLDTAISQLEKFVSASKFDSFDKFSKNEQFFGEGSKGSKYLPYLRVCLEAEEKRPNRSEQSIINAANRIIQSIDSIKIAIYFGTNHESTDPKMQEEKNYLINALYKKALSESLLLSEKKIEYSQLSETLTELSKWIDNNDTKQIRFNVTLNENKKLYSLALAELSKILSDPKLSSLDKKPFYETQIRYFENLGWNVFSEDLKRLMLVRYPNNFPIF